MKHYHRIACVGGLYSNYLALQVALQDIARREVDQIFCLGDLGAFGPHPDRIFPLLHEFEVICLQGNYDDSIGHALDDCQCGYTDPRDNHFAQLSYDYTLANTSSTNRAFLRTLPKQQQIHLGDRKLLLCHGSPRRVNEFLWESATSDAFLNYLCEVYEVNAIVATHSGIKWHRQLASNRDFINVGVLGRPENDGKTNVWYTLLESSESLSANDTHELKVEFIPVNYDHERLAAEMRAEHLPEEFVETLLTGWWTTCLEVLPGKERRRGRW